MGKNHIVIRLHGCDSEVLHWEKIILDEQDARSACTARIARFEAKFTMFDGVSSKPHHRFHPHPSLAHDGAGKPNTAPSTIRAVLLVTLGTISLTFLWWAWLRWLV